MSDFIEMAIHRPITTQFLLADKWTFKPKGRSRWLQQQAWRFLQWCGALSNAVENKTTYRRVVFRGSTVLEQIAERQRALLERGFRPARVLIGAEDMDAMLADPAFRDMATFGAPVDFRAPAGFGREVYGLRITIVPWMKGILILDERSA